MTTSLLRPHAVAGIIGGRNSPLPLAKNKNHTVGLRRKSAIPAKKIRDLKLRRGARVAVAAASASGDDERIGSNVASRIATNIATAASTMLVRFLTCPFYRASCTPILVSLFPERGVIFRRTLQALQYFFPPKKTPTARKMK